MEVQAVTIRLPDPLYQRVKERAERSHRTIEAELLEMVNAATPASNGLDPNLAAALPSLHYLDDKTLWQAARSHLPAKAIAKMERLHLKRSSGKILSEAETKTLAELLKQYDYYLLIRAKATEILHARGHDVSVLLEQKKR